MLASNSLAEAIGPSPPAVATKVIIAIRQMQTTLLPSQSNGDEHEHGKTDGDGERVPEVIAVAGTSDEDDNLHCLQDVQRQGLVCTVPDCKEEQEDDDEDEWE